jgi:hypothetical protein
MAAGDAKTNRNLVAFSFASALCNCASVCKIAVIQVVCAMLVGRGLMRMHDFISCSRA